MGVPSVAAVPTSAGALSPETLRRVQQSLAEASAKRTAEQGFEQRRATMRRRVDPPSTPPTEGHTDDGDGAEMGTVYRPVYVRVPQVDDVLSNNAVTTCVAKRRTQTVVELWAGAVPFAPAALEPMASLPMTSPWRSSQTWTQKVLPLLQARPGADAGRQEIFRGASNVVYHVRSATQRKLGFPDGLQSCVFRVTLGDQGCTWEELVDEANAALAAAAEGFGPSVYAVVAFLKSAENEKGPWGLLLVMERCQAPLHSHAGNLVDQALSRQTVRMHGENAAASLLARCAQMANLGYVHFDLKCGNVMRGYEGEFKAPNALERWFAIDFDPFFYVAPDDAVLGVRARLFVSLLLITLHASVWAWTSDHPEFYQGFRNVMRWPLMELHLEARAAAAGAPDSPAARTFGAGGAWLRTVTMPVWDERSVLRDTDTEARETADPRWLRRMFSVMVYMYFFDVPRDNAGNQCGESTAAEIRGWRWKQSKDSGFTKEFAPLIPQLLAFTLFHNHSPENIPSRWRESLEF